ncbi:MAG: ATP-binding protein [Candidatus Lustribacter sp.]|jgi:PAS domain S-box-containing protein
MDRAILHDIRNELAVATGTIHAFIDGKLPTDPNSLGRVLAALENVDSLLTEFRSTIRPPEPGRERLLQAIVEGSPFAQIVVNQSGKITLVNVQAERMFGYAREELLGQAIEMLVPARFRRGHPHLRDSYNEAPSARPMGGGRELFGRRSDGSEFPVEIGLNPIETEAGTFTLAAVSDITERKRSEELAGVRQHAAEIQELNDELAAASRFKSEFVATMSHELRTPLTAIIGSAELLGRMPLDSRAGLHVATINESAEALLALIGSVLDFSKIEAGRLDLRNEPFTVDAVLEGTAEVVAQLAREKGITFHTYVDPAIPPLSGDADRLRQVLLNLMGNAVKFSDGGQIVARAFPVELGSEDVLLRFEVQDMGIGIAPDVLSRLFEPFVQADTARKFAGSGLGLSITKSLVELMGGEVGVQSEVGAGSLFWFTARFARSTAAPQNISLKNVAGLIVSNDDEFVRIVARYMDAWGMRSHHVANREQLLAAVTGDPASTWIALVDDSDGDRRLADVIEAVHASERARIVVVGGESLRKPLRQSYLFDAIANAAGVERADLPVPPPAESVTRSSTDLPVLVAEDNANLQALLKLQFEEIGVPVVFASDGNEAIAALAAGNYALAFMDCHMPKMDGLTATRAIRAAERGTGKHVPIVAMTANAFAEDREACFAAGMDDYLAKPVRLNNLRAVLERWAPITPAT